MAPGETTTVEVEAPRRVADGAGGERRVHVIQTGHNEGNEAVMWKGWPAALLRSRRGYVFPVYSYLLEHPEGLIAIDTGSSSRTKVSRLMYKTIILPPATPMTSREQEIDVQMKAAGLDPEDVSRVVLTHLDWDHAGGLRHFPQAEVLVHRPEHDFSQKALGRARYQPKLWPETFDPVLYDMDPEPYGPFPQSKAITEAGDVRVVPIPGHSVAQVGVIVETGEDILFFAADHVLRQDWFLEQYAAGNLRGLATYPKPAIETSRRIRALAEERPTVFLPSHDAETPARLERREPLRFNGT